MTPDLYLGIDPGKSGGIATLYPDGRGCYSWKHPETEADLRDLLLSIQSRIIEACIEKVHTMPAEDFKAPSCPVCGRKKLRQGISSSGAFLQNYGFLRGLLVGLRIPFEEVPPVTWQRYQHCLTGGDKNISKANAQQRWPLLRITHATADALLIADYCRRKCLGLLEPPVKVIRQAKPNLTPRIPFAGQEQVEDF